MQNNMKNPLQYVRRNIAELTPYSTARDEYKGPLGVFLDANESPYDNGVNRYPDPAQKQLKKLLAGIKGAGAENIFIGNGSDEAIDLCFRVFCNPGRDTAVAIAPSYGMYKVASAINDVRMREVQLEEDFSLSTEKLFAAVDSTTKLLWLCSPNNPSGNCFPTDQLTEIIERFDGIVVLDEAYIDFAPSQSLLPTLMNHPNLIILQTLSKAWGMAGLRLGLAFADSRIIDLFSRVKYPYNINCVTQKMVAERLMRGIERQVAEICSEREKIAGQLKKCRAIEKVYPSSANFVLVKTSDADRLYDRLIEGGIIVRNRSRIKGCEGCLRITVGTPSENEKMLKIINEYA